MTDMEKMQADAVNSARAMYRRRTPVRTTTIPPPHSEPIKEKNDETEPKMDNLKYDGEAAAIKKQDLIGSLFQDKERALIILLIILLSEDGADSGVIMALLYCII